MFPEISLPWWGWGYLILALIVFVISWSVEAARSHDNILASTLSLFTICVSVIGFFNPPVIAFLGFFIIPMVALGVFWEFTRAVKETDVAQAMLEEDPELTEKERDFLLNIAIGFNALIILPGYIMGLILCFNVLGFV